MPDLRVALIPIVEIDAFAQSNLSAIVLTMTPGVAIESSMDVSADTIQINVTPLIAVALE